MGRRLRHPLRVRYSECDPQGVVFNAHYLSYFDVGITELWREAIGPWSELVDRGYDMVVAEANVRYLSSLRFDDEFDLCAAVEKIGTTSMITRLWIEREGETLAEGTLRHVFVEAGGGAKVEVPDDVRGALEPFGTGAA